MLFMRRITSNLLATGAVALCVVFAPASQAESASAKKDAAQVEAEFRGCESAGWCRFQIDSADPSAAMLYRVRPDGIARIPVENFKSTAMRNRLNALLSNMIHQAKHIVLDDLRRLDDGTFAARVTINGANIATDPMVVELQDQAAGKTR